MDLRILSSEPRRHVADHLPSPPPSLRDRSLSIERRELPAPHLGCRTPLALPDQGSGIAVASSSACVRRRSPRLMNRAAAATATTTMTSTTEKSRKRSLQGDHAAAEQRNREHADSSPAEETGEIEAKCSKRPCAGPPSSPRRERSWACPLVQFDPEGERRCCLELRPFSSPHQVRFVSLHPGLSRWREN